MKLYRIWDKENPAEGDAWFPTRKAAETYLAEQYDIGDAEIQEKEYDGPLTKTAVCWMLTNWPAR